MMVDKGVRAWLDIVPHLPVYRDLLSDARDAAEIDGDVEEAGRFVRELRALDAIIEAAK